MSEFVIQDAKENVFYRFMEDGKPVCGSLGAATFDEVMAPKVCEQLATFKGADWRPIPMYPPQRLNDLGKTQQGLAELIGVHPSTLRSWAKKGRISLPYLARVHALVSEA